MNRGFAGTALPNAMMSTNQQITFNAANCGPPGGVMQLVSPPAYGVLQSPSSSSSQQPQISMVQQPSFRLPFVDVDAVFQNEINSAYQVGQPDLKPLTTQYFSGTQPNVVTSSTINTSPSNVTNLTSAVMLKDAPFYAVSASASQNANTAANTSGTSHSQMGEAKFSNMSPIANGLNSSMSVGMTQNASGRYACAICGDRATGKHYGVVSCEGCKGFFKRTVRKSLQYACREDRHCPIDKRQRNRCQFCRFEKCLQTGMKREAVQEERARANAAFANQRTPNASGSANASCSPTESASASASASSAPVSGELRALLDEFINDTDDERQHAARAIVNWAKRIRPFAELPIDDRIALLRAGWNELLIATLAYRNAVASGRSRRRMNAATNSSSGNGSFTAALNGDWSLSHESKDDEDEDDDADTADGSGSETDTTTTLTFGDGVSVSRAAAHRAGVGVGHVFDRVVTEIVAQMRQLSIDYVELALIRAIILFNPDARGVTRVSEVERARERVYLALELQCRAQHAADDARFAKLLLRLPALRSVGLKCVEHLFFLKLFGEAPADAAVRELLTFSSSSSHNDALSSASGSTEHGLLQSA